MKKEIINASNFDKCFNQLLKNKKAKNILNGRFNLEVISLNKKSVYLISFLSSFFHSLIHITYKILYWEEDKFILNFLQKNDKNKLSTLILSYKNGSKPGIVYVDEKKEDKVFLKSLLDNHFNYELAKSPSLNIRVQICLNLEEEIILLDIYDDRGFDMYYFLSSEICNRRLSLSEDF